jgi:hypothetical protein
LPGPRAYAPSTVGPLRMGGGRANRGFGTIRGRKPERRPLPPAGGGESESTFAREGGTGAVPVNRGRWLNRLGVVLWAVGLLIAGGAVALLARSWIVGLIFVASVVVLQTGWMMWRPRRGYRRVAGTGGPVLPAVEERQALVTRVTPRRPQLDPPRPEDC